MVEVCGGSRQLLTVVNRLACASSPDAHNRFVTLYAEDVARQAMESAFQGYV